MMSPAGLFHCFIFSGLTNKPSFSCSCSCGCSGGPRNPVSHCEPEFGHLRPACPLSILWQDRHGPAQEPQLFSQQRSSLPWAQHGGCDPSPGGSAAWTPRSNSTHLHHRAHGLRSGQEDGPLLTHRHLWQCQNRPADFLPTERGSRKH